MILLTYQPEALHVISHPGRYRQNIAQARESSPVLHTRPLEERLEHLPTPLAIHVVACDPVHVKQALDRLRALHVVAV